MLENPTGGKQEGIILIRHFSRRYMVGRLEQAQTTGELAHMHELSSRMVSGRTRPLQAAQFLQPVIIDSRHGRSQGSHFIPNLAGACIIHGIAHAADHFADSLPVGSSRNGFDGFSNSLYPALGIAKGAVTFSKTSSR